MDEESIINYIKDTFEGVELSVADGNTFFMYDPAGKFPFATLVTNDAYENISNLSRPSVFRLNIGISKQTFRSLFGVQAAPADQDTGADSAYDFTAIDQLLPHPIYGSMYWVCILNPSAATFEAVVQPLLAEAYELDVRKHAKRATRK
jgi:hypothetical protein